MMDHVMENADLKVSLAILLLAILSMTLPLDGSLLKVLFGLPLVLFLPGYVLISVLFPRKRDLEPLERIGFGFASSIAVVPAIGLILNSTSAGITSFTMTLSLTAYMMVMLYLAYAARMRIEPDRRFVCSCNLPVGK